MPTLSSLLLLAATFLAPALAQGTTYPRSDIEFTLHYCNDGVTANPNPHLPAHLTWNLVKLYSPSSNSTQYVSAGNGFVYTPYWGNNLTAAFWTDTLPAQPRGGQPRGLLAMQIDRPDPVVGYHKLDIYAGKVIFEERVFECVALYGSGLTGGGYGHSDDGFDTGYTWCGGRYLCKQWETSPARDKTCTVQHTGLDNCRPLWWETG